VNQLTIGITGHRRLSDAQRMRRSVELFFTDLQTGQFAALETWSSLTLLSPLAEGADRIFAHSGLSIPNSNLHAVLPLPAAEYRQDFETPESCNDFDFLLSQAQQITVMQSQPSRGNSYEAAGRFVAERCDILVAIWDGKASRGIGGTGAIVSYFRQTRRPLYWINSEVPSRIVKEHL
jgi:hypothetical protein